METVRFETLTPQEREELALCGITSPAQLKQSNLAHIIRDLEQARQFFPGKTFILNEDRLNELFIQPEDVEEAAEEEDAEGLKLSAAKPTTGFISGIRHQQESSKKSKKGVITDLHSPVRCAHPFLSIFASWCTLFMIVPIISIVALPVMLLTNNMPDMTLESLALIVFGVPCLLYMLIGRSATCPVCHMHIYRFSHYSRNRAAHHLPLLGYNFTTALHLLLLWRFNCPACGTPVKLFTRKGRKTHH